VTTNVLDLIGNTPLVELRCLNPNPAVRVWAKLEYLNPGGSIKDRAALAMIEAGEASGELTPEKTVIEATSGNTGIGLAMVCAVKGYRLLLAMSESVSIERQKILKARGAEILLTPGHMGTDGAIEEVYRLARENPDLYFMTDQFNNAANWMAHYKGTAEEIWTQTRGRVKVVVATLGTSGTLMGVSQRLKELEPAVAVVGVEPYLGHKIQGLKNMKESYCPGIFQKKRLDRKVNIDDDEAFDMTRRLARDEGLLVGMSSGAAVAVALKEAMAMKSGELVVILPDSGERYLSTPLFDVKEKVELMLFNMMSREREPFVPLRPGKVSVFTCGPTAYDCIRVGVIRRFMVSDLLSRYLEYRGYTVTRVMNITDFDDRTIEGSEAAGEKLEAFTGRYQQAILSDLNRLGIQPADHYPRASEHIDEMVRTAEELQRSGYAYEKLRSLYFDISRFDGYGRLSGIDVEKIKLGATVDLDEYEKDNPRDFTLFKRSKLAELKRGIYTKTPWGNVRPSWHLQGAAIALKYLGDRFDVHASSRDLMFPHHENFNAIAAALNGHSPARYWIDCEQVLVDGHKDSDLNHGPSLDNLVERGFTVREIRFWLLTTHYRKPLTCADDRLENSRRSLKRLDNCIANLQRVEAGTPYPEIDQLLYDLRHGFADAMDDDLNIAEALASLYKCVKTINRLILSRELDAADAGRILEALQGLNRVLNVLEFRRQDAAPEVYRLVQQRQQARERGDWPLADRLRDELRTRGVEVRDEKIEAEPSTKPAKTSS